MKRLSNIWYLGIFILLAVGIIADSEPPTLSIRQFKGVDESTNLLNLEPGQATICRNWDLGQNPGMLQIREGISKYTRNYVAYNDSGDFTGLYSYNPRKGSPRLFATWSFDTNCSYFKSYPYGWVLNTGVYSAAFQITNWYPFHYKTDAINGVTYNNIGIIGRDHGRPLRYAGGSVQPLVEPPPGCWQYTPTPERTVTTNKLSGWYYYAMRYMKAKLTGSTVSYVYLPRADSMNLEALSPRIKVDSDWVFIHSPEMTGYSNCDNNYDSTIVQICRTRADRTWSDSFFVIGERRFANDTTSTTLIHFIDSVKDGHLVADTGSHRFAGFYDTVSRTLDSQCVGTPSSISSDSSMKLGGVGWKSTVRVSYPNGWKGIGDGYESTNDTSWVATRYVILYYDSATNGCSPSGPAARIPVAYRSGPADSIYDTSIIVWLPRLPTHKTHLWRLVARAQETESRMKVSDTTRPNDYPATWVHGTTTSYQHWACEHGGSLFRKDNGSYWCRPGLQIRDTTIRQTLVSEYRIIDTIKSAATTYYTDHESWGNDWLGMPVVPAVADIPQMNYFTVLRDRVYGASGSRVYYSAIELNASEPALWLIGNAHDISPDDGDEITGLLVDGDKILVTKHKSLSHFIPGQDELLLSGVGCIAPLSLKQVPGGGYTFLSDDGIYLFTGHLQSLYKTSGGNIGRISDPIQSHIKGYSEATKRGCCTWFPNDWTACYSFPGVDTTWTYSMNTGQWSAWTFAFKQTVNYDTTWRTYLKPSADVLGIKNATDTVFKFGGVHTDATAAIRATWRSGPLFQQQGWGQIYKYMLWSASDTSKPIIVRWYDQDGVKLDTIIDSSVVRGRQHAVKPYDAQYWQVEIETTNDSLAVYNLGLWWKKVAEGIEY